MTSEYIINDKRTAFRLDVNVNIGYKSINQNNFYLCQDAISSGFDIYKWDMPIEDIRFDLIEGMKLIKAKLKDDQECTEVLKKMDFAIDTLASQGRVVNSSDFLVFDKIYDQIVNLSEGGIKFTSHDHFYPGTKLILSLELLPSGEKILAFATAQYVDSKKEGNDIKGLFGEDESASPERNANKNVQYTVKATLDFFNQNGKEVLKEYLLKSLEN